MSALFGLVLSCGAPAAKAPTTEVPPLHTDPLTDLAPAASLAWLVDVRPREIAGHAELLPALELVLPAERARAFAATHGGVDPLEASEIALARYPSSTLWLVRTSFDAGAVEAAFAARALRVEGRSVDWAESSPASRIVRTWGALADDRVQLALLGQGALGLEVGRFGPLRATEAFAEGRLRKASPSLRAPPLWDAAARLGDAPVRAFAPGPFEGELSKGVGGLLAVTTAAGGAVRIVAGDRRGPPPDRPGLACTVVLLGVWKDDASAAGERLLAAYQLLAQSGPGRLFGLDHPVAPARVRTSVDALTLEVTLDAYALARGLHDATAADAREILGIRE